MTGPTQHTRIYRKTASTTHVVNAETADGFLSGAVARLAVTPVAGAVGVWPSTWGVFAAASLRGSSAVSRRRQRETLASSALCPVAQAMMLQESTMRAYRVEIHVYCLRLGTHRQCLDVGSLGMLKRPQLVTSTP